MNTSLLVPQQVPEFVLTEHPAFVEFLRAYYEWFESTYMPGDLTDIVELDRTADEFVDYFRNQLDIYGITRNTNDRMFLRHIKQMYAAKGSTAAYEFLFKVLFNKTATVSEPWDNVMIPSNGKWVQDISILVRVTKGSPNDFTGNFVTITDVNGQQYRVYVTDHIDRRNGVVELFINRFRPRDTLSTVATSDGTAAATVLNTTTKVTVERAGAGFSVGQVFAVDSDGGTGSLAKVKSVTAEGGITAMDIIQFGVGYDADFNILITPTDQLDPGSIGPRIQLGSLTYGTDDKTSQGERGLVVKHDYTRTNPDYFRDYTYVGQLSGVITTHSGSLITEAANYASIKFTSGQINAYPGYYADSTNIIGDLIYLQDSNYYQLYSYVTTVDEALDQYKAILRNVLHPTGMKHFATYLITNTVQLLPQVAAALNVLASETSLVNGVTLLDAIVREIGKSITTPVMIADSSVLTIGKSISTSLVGIGDQLQSFDISKSITTVATVSDDFLISPGQVAVSQTFAVDALSSTVDKYLNETVALSSAGGLYMGPYYVEPLPPYWEAGYLENERSFT